MKCLRSLGLFPHHDRVKSWDTLKMIDIIKQANISAFVLDVGCNGSPILPLLRRLGFMNLYGCDLFLKEEISADILPLLPLNATNLLKAINQLQELLILNTTSHD